MSSVRSTLRWLAVAGALGSIAQAARCSAAATKASGQWVQTFYDDFDGNSLNSSIWNVNDRVSVISQYDGHDALFVKERVSVANSNLIIETILDPQVFNGVSYNMTSGWVDTQNKLSQYQGRFEASMKMPDAGAQGAWPAWWLLPVNACWPVSGEVDIVEIWMGEGHFQHNKVGNPISMASTYHFGYGCSDDVSSYTRDSRWFPNMSDTSAPLIDFSADYHTFGVEWNDTALRFYVDSNTSFVMTLPNLCASDPDWQAGGGWGHAPYMPFQPMYGIFDVAVSPNTNTTWWETHNATTYIDWVRWYQWVPDVVEVDSEGATLDETS